MQTILLDLYTQKGAPKKAESQSAKPGQGTRFFARITLWTCGRKKASWTML